MDGKAVILTKGLFQTDRAKTAHGLVRATDRYEIVGVIDDKLNGQDAGEILDGKHRGIRGYNSINEFIEAGGEAAYCVVGVAFAGGKLPKDMIPVLKEAIQNKMSPVCGLHEYMSDNAELSAEAEKHGVELIDIRRPKPSSKLHFWTGDIKEVGCPKIAILGADCNIGKRTTTRFLTEAATAAGLKAEMIYTGQTGWLQGSKYGLILDSTLNDFVSGEIEHAVLSAWRNEKPDMIFIEGQAALRNPSGPCGSEYLISGEVDGVILQYAPAREYYNGWEHLNKKMVSLESEIELIKLYGAKPIAVTLNLKGMPPADVPAYKEKYSNLLGIPVISAIEDGVESLIPVIQALKS